MAFASYRSSLRMVHVTARKMYGEESASCFNEEDIRTSLDYSWHPRHGSLLLQLMPEGKEVMLSPRQTINKIMKLPIFRLNAFGGPPLMFGFDQKHGRAACVLLVLHYLERIWDDIIFTEPRPFPQLWEVRKLTDQCRA